MEQYYKIAGLVVQMDAAGITAERARAYVCPPAPVDITVRTHWERLLENRPHLTPEEAEYLATGLCFYRELLRYDGFMLHSSAVVVDGQAYLFTADSGVGKSTHVGLWLQQFGDRAYILNDDKPALRYEDGIWYAYGTPWSGKHDLSADRRIPVAGIAVLQRGAENRISPFFGPKSVQALFKQMNRPRDVIHRTKLLELLDRLFVTVPIWQLTCNTEPEAALVAYRAMVQKGRTE